MMQQRGAIRTWFAGLVCLATLLCAAALFAGDEDMSPSAYHVFDPETGYMMTVDPLAEEQIVDANADPAVNAGESAAETPGRQAVGLALSQVLIYATVAVVLIGGFVVWRRNQGKAV